MSVFEAILVHWKLSLVKNGLRQIIMRIFRLFDLTLIFLYSDFKTSDCFQRTVIVYKLGPKLTVHLLYVYLYESFGIINSVEKQNILYVTYTIMIFSFDLNLSIIRNLQHFILDSRTFIDTIGNKLHCLSKLSRKLPFSTEMKNLRSKVSMHPRIFGTRLFLVYFRARWILDWYFQRG